VDMAISFATVMLDKPLMSALSTISFFKKDDDDLRSSAFTGS
jgi:hypothetical protein